MDSAPQLDRYYRLAPKARLRWDATRRAHFLLYPERGLKLNATAAAILLACDGANDLGAICEQVAQSFAVSREQIERDASAFFIELIKRGLLVEGRS